jgi:hypothetical protein
MAESLAGADGEVVPLRELSEASFRRALSEAEVYMLRTAILGRDPDLFASEDEAPAAVVGYICAGKPVPPDAGRSVIAVADHVNLAWRSPLTGPNDDRLGPRFPITAGMYEPERVLAGLGAGTSSPAKRGIIGGVRDARFLLEFELRMARERRLDAISSELVPVALLAAHMGIRLAAAVVVEGEE